MSDKQPRIARIWRGSVVRARADEYAKYLYERGIRPLEEKALGVQLFREDRETESEFVTVSTGKASRRCRASQATIRAASTIWSATLNS
jgi:hypothetical protein